VIVRLRAGQLRQASEMLSATFEYVVSSGNIETLATSIELSAAIAAELAVGAALSQQEAVALLLSPSSEIAPRPRPAARRPAARDAV
jgi:hypothetical protein